MDPMGPVSPDQYKELSRMRQWLKDHGYKGKAYSDAWAKVTTYVMDPKARAAMDSSDKMLSAPKGDVDWNSMSGWQKTKAVEKGVGEALVGYMGRVLPKSFGGGAGDIALMGAGLLFPPAEGAGMLGSVARLGARLAVPPMVAGAAAETAGQDPEGPMISTGIQALGGEGINKAIDIAGRIPAAKIIRNTVKTMGRWLGQAFPAYKDTIETNSDLYKAFSPLNKDNLPTTIGKALRAIEGRTAQHLGGSPLSIPALSQGLKTAGLNNLVNADDDYTFEQATKLIEKLNKIGYSGGEPSSKAIASQVRASTHSALDEMSDELENYTPGLGTAYRDARNQYAGALTLKDILGSKGVKLSSGHVNLPELSRLLLDFGPDGYAQDLARTFGPDKAKSLAEGVMLRGAPMGSAMDTAEKGGLLSRLRVFAHPGGFPSIGFHPSLEGSTPPFAGNVRRFPQMPPAARGIPGILLGPAGQAGAETVEQNQPLTP